MSKQTDLINIPGGKLELYGSGISDIPLAINHAWGSSSTALISASAASSEVFKVGRDGDLTLSGGVYLGGTGSANKLDDYEEGTWTPVFTGINGSSPTGNFNHQGNYTKIGRQVHLIGYMEVTSGLSTGSGSLGVSGLPFTSPVGDGNHSTGAVTANNWDTDRNVYLAVTHYNSTNLGFLTANDNGNWNWENVGSLRNQTYMRFSLTYYTTQ